MSKIIRAAVGRSRKERAHPVAYSWSKPEAAARQVYRAGPIERVEIVRRGIPATYVLGLSKGMGISREKLYATLGLPRATIDRKVSQKTLLSSDESERIAGIAQLVGQAQAIVEQSGSSEGFDPALWVAEWLDRVHPALGGRRPGEFMDTSYGRALVSDLLAQQQSGSYA